MPIEQLRSRANAVNNSSNSDLFGGADNNEGFDPKDKEALNARLSDRRRQRREQRLKKQSPPSSASSTFQQQQQQLGGSTTPNTTKKMMANNRRRNLLQQRSSRQSTNRLIYGLIVCILIVIWLMGFLFLANRTHTTLDPHKNSKGPFQQLRQRFSGAVASQLQAIHQQQKNSNNNNSPSSSAISVVKGDPNQVIDMRELNAHLKFDNEKGGAWTQGWDVEPVPIGSHEKPLRIFVVPHSHCDPGWIKTFDDYFQSQTKQILSTVIEALDQHPKRKFIWAEISYFEWWWREQKTETQEVVRRLLENGQFEFVTGGWVQPDEANTQLYAMEIQLQEGHDFIRNTFGEKHIPKYGWSIDPFGYSPTMAYLLKKYDFRAMLIQRVHYRIKKELAKSKHLEFMWRQTWDKTGEYDIFTHVMPFYSYDVPHTCGPNPAICCQFDFARIRGATEFVGTCPWGKQPSKIHDLNVEERAMLLLDQYRKKANLYQSNVVIAPLGDDFRYRTRQEADFQFENYQRIFDYINEKVEGVEISFGTLSEYFQAAMGTFTPPLLKGSFFTYADRDEDYWSGYFTSRIFDKALDRQLERVLYAASSLGADKLELQEARRALSLFQHHDGVTGTAKTHVVADYAAKIHKAIRLCQDWIIQKFEKTKKASDGSSSSSSLTNLKPCWQSDAPRGLSSNLCGESGDVLVYNPLGTDQFCGDVKVPGWTSVKATLPCEIPGSVPDSKAGIQFDPHTGFMTHPVKEEWMVWKVTMGGAYLFFPGKLTDYEEDHFEIEQGGYVVKTKHWKRTVVEKSETLNGVTATAIDFVYETFLQNPNEEWFVRFTGSQILNEGVFHTDLNGYNFDTHHFRSDMPIQSQVFPMPTLASIEDEHQRLTILSEHAQGTASLEEGSIDVWLDRRLAQDDERGLGQGVMDNVPTRTRLRVVLETEGYQHANPEFEITSFCKLMWKQLNHPLEMFGRLKGGELLPIADLKPDEPHKSINKVSKAFSSDKYIIPPVYMVYKRVDYLKEAIESLLHSDFPRDRIPIIISHDGHIDAMTDYVESIKSDFHVIQLFHPHACSEHPNSFPGDDPTLNKNYQGDEYGNPRDGKITCCKHHFTWLMNQAFELDEVKDADGFLFLEEDYIVAPTIYETIEAGLDYLDKSGKRDHFFGLTLDSTEGYSYTPPSFKGWIEKRFVTGPMVLRRDMFQKIKDNAKEYCTFDEYNW